MAQDLKTWMIITVIYTQLKIQDWTKNADLSEIRIHDLRDTNAVIYQLSYEVEETRKWPIAKK